MTGTHCPICHALGTPSGYLPHAPLCPNGITQLAAWGAPYERLDQGAEPARATSHVRGVGA